MTPKNPTDCGRRSVLKAIGGTGVAGLAGCISGGDGGEFPSQDITVLMTKGEGGATDVYTRNLVGPAIESLGVDPQFEYVTGAGGLRGLSVLLQREADGHTMCSFNIAGGIFSYLINEPGFDITDFTPIATTSVGAFTMFTHPNHDDVSTIDDVIGKYRNDEWEVIAGQGNGDATNALILLMADSEDYGIEYDSYTEYGGTAPTAQALSTGEIPVMVGSDGGARQYYRNGDIRDVAVLRSGGSPIFPDIPTAADQGYPTWDYLATVRRGFVAHPDTSSDHQETLDQAFADAAESDDVRAWEEESGMPITYMDHEEYGQGIRDGVEQVPEIIDISQFQ